MKTVSILVHEDAILSSVAGPLDILSRSNQFLENAGRRPLFEVELVSEKLRNVPLVEPAQFMCQRTLDEVNHTDLIVVPAFYGEPATVLEKHRALVEWLKVKPLQGAEVASLCVGSYFLAEAGLLDGKACTCHWRAAEDLQRRYPRIRVKADSVMTDQEGVYTGGGAFSSLNLVLYLVEKFCGRDIGLLASKNFSLHMDQLSQAHFAVFQGQRQHHDESILKAQTYIESHYREEINGDELAHLVNMSKRNFLRRFKSATRNTPLEYLQRVRIEAGKKALENSSQNINTLMYDVGYNDGKTFRELFKRITGLTPQAYRDKYRRA